MVTIQKEINSIILNHSLIIGFLKKKITWCKTCHAGGQKKQQLQKESDFNHSNLTFLCFDVAVRE